MNLNQSRPLMGGWLTDMGHYAAQSVRSGIETAGKAISTISSRGGADSDVVVQDNGANNYSQYYAPAAVVGLGALAVIIMAAKKKKKRKTRR